MALLTAKIDNNQPTWAFLCLIDVSNSDHVTLTGLIYAIDENHR